MRPKFLDRIGVDDRLFAALLAVCCVVGCSIPLPPGPTPDPINPTPVVPIVVKPGLRVLIVRETADQLPASQSDIFTSAPFRKFIADNKASLKIWDDDVDIANESDQEFVKLLQVPRASLPWIVVAGGSKTVSQPLPKTVEDTEALIAGAK